LNTTGLVKLWQKKRYNKRMKQEGRERIE